jgi:hypothetical protein
MGSLQKPVVVPMLDLLLGLLGAHMVQGITRHNQAENLRGVKEKKKKVR